MTFLLPPRSSLNPICSYSFLLPQASGNHSNIILSVLEIHKLESYCVCWLSGEALQIAVKRREVKSQYIQYILFKIEIGQQSFLY